MTLTVKLADQEQSRLDAITVAIKATNQSDAIRILINEKFEALQADQTLVERRGGHPKYLLEASPDLSDRDRRKASIAAHLKAKAKRRR